MSLFPRFQSTELPVNSLLRLLDDPFYHPMAHQHHSTNRSNRVFQPNFDVHETKDAYHLEGEVPGISDKSKLDIEFVDSQTLVIKGRIERSHTTDDSGASGQQEEDKQDKPKKPTVEDAGEEGKEGGKEGTQGGTDTTMTRTNNEQGVSKSSGPQRKYWVSERVVGEFQRSFSFPQGVDQDGVKASLKDGILSITVPKRQQKGSRKISVE